MAGSASRAGLSSAPGGGTESLPPPHKLLPLPQPGSQTPPHPTAEAAASFSRVAARCCREAGRRHRKGPGRAPLSHLSRAAGTYLADCEPVSLEGGGRKRTRGVGETERANTKKHNFALFHQAGISEQIPSFHLKLGGRGGVGTVGVKAGAPDRSAHWLLPDGH